MTTSTTIPINQTETEKKALPEKEAVIEKEATPLKEPASTEAKPAKKPAAKVTAAKPAVKPAAKVTAAKPVTKTKPVTAPAVKKAPLKAATKAVTKVKAAATKVTKAADHLDDFKTKVETFEVPTSAAAKAPEQAVKVTETTEVKVTALPQSTSKLVTGDHREPKQSNSQPRFDKKSQYNKGKPQQAQHQRRGDPRMKVQTTDHRANLTRKILGENPTAHSSAAVVQPIPEPVADLIPGIGAPAAQFASHALKAIKHATPEDIDRIATTVADNVVDQFGSDAGNLAASVAKKMTPEVESNPAGSALNIITESLERAKLSGLPPDDAAKRSLRGALTTLMTNQHEVMNSPAKKNANGMLDLTALFKPR